MLVFVGDGVVDGVAEIKNDSALNVELFEVLKDRASFMPNAVSVADTVGGMSARDDDCIAFRPIEVVDLPEHDIEAIDAIDDASFRQNGALDEDAHVGTDAVLRFSEAPGVTGMLKSCIQSGDILPEFIGVSIVWTTKSSYSDLMAADGFCIAVNGKNTVNKDQSK